MAISEAHLVGDSEFRAKLSAMRAIVHNKIVATMKRQMFMVAEYIRANKLSGQVLNRRSGDLSRATTGQVVSDTETMVTGEVGTHGIPYAPVHEFGGTFERTISQAFGRPIIPREVTFHYPERSFIRTGVNDRKESVMAAFRQTAVDLQGGRQ